MSGSINFYCRSSKADKKGYSPIEVGIYLNGKRVFFNLPRKETSSEFSKAVKKQSSEINEYLSIIRRNINTAQTQLLERGIPVTAERLKEIATTGGIKSFTLDDMFSEFITIQRKRAEAGEITELSYKKYVIVAERFKRFRKGSLEASSIVPADIREFMAVLGTENGKATVCAKMTRLRSMFLHAFESGKIKAFPFNGVHYSRPAPNIEFLTVDEVERIKSLNTDIERLAKVRDLFLFQIHSGLAYIDLSILQPEDMHINGDLYYIRKKRQKTGIEFTAVILPYGVEIWNRYEGHLPMLSNQKFNSYLDEIADLCGIRKTVTTHMARRTYGTYLLNAGIPITTVSKMLGHNSTKITEKHYAKVIDETIFNDIAKIL